MTHELAVSLSDIDLAFIDLKVERGEASDRASYVAELVREERQRHEVTNERQLRTDRAPGPDPELVQEWEKRHDNFNF